MAGLYALGDYPQGHYPALMWRQHDDYEAKTARPSPGPKDLRSQPATRSTYSLHSSQGRALTIHELADYAGLTTGQVRYALALPLKERLVVMDGRQGARTTYYRIHTVC